MFTSQINLSSNQLCGLNWEGSGTYTAEGITAIADALKVTASVTNLNLSNNNLTSETGYVKATEVQGDSKEVGAKVIYQGREMTVSKGVDSDGELKMQDLTGVHAIAEALAGNASLTSVR